MYLGLDPVGREVAPGFVDDAVGRRVALADVEHRERQAERRHELGGLVHRRRRALTPVVGEQRAADRAELDRRDQHRLRTLARHALRGAAEQPGREALVDPAVTDHDQIGGARLLADLVGDDAAHELRVGAHAAFVAAREELLEDDASPLLEGVAHLRREVEIRLEAEGSGHVVKEGARSFDRDHVDDVQPDGRRLQAFRHPERVLGRGLRVLRAIQRHENALDHGLGPAFTTMIRAREA